MRATSFRREPYVSRTFGTPLPPIRVRLVLILYYAGRSTATLSYGALMQINSDPIDILVLTENWLRLSWTPRRRATLRSGSGAGMCSDPGLDAYPLDPFAEPSVL